ncbi:MAG: hydantoinase B/oxoprolinase family protein [Paracoccaceae bacterium]
MFWGLHRETYNTLAEISQARNGVFVDQIALNTALGGEGEFHRQCGLSLNYRIHPENWFCRAGFTRSAFNAWSLQGGYAGRGNFVVFILVNGNRSTHSFVSNRPMTTGDMIPGLLRVTRTQKIAIPRW